MEKENERENKKSDAATREEKILEFWRENKTFERSVEQRKGGKEFIFYDGPVTANSKPVLHTMVPFSFKDVLPRYKTMRGYYAPRKGGWDTHGLPVELQIEKKLGFKSKSDIEAYGIAAFNKLCKDSVWEYIDLWKNFTKRMGYWADQDNAYVTYHNDYIESLWNIVKKVNERKLLYKDYKVVPWCPRCGTALSSHELAQGYEDVKDLSVYVKFRVRQAEKNSSTFLQPSAGTFRHQNSSLPVYILAWTTTPWTLPGNVGLAVGENIDYVEIKVKDEILVLAKERLSVITDPYEILAEHKGKEMVGMEYEPLFPYLTDTIPESEKPKFQNAYKVYPADFVNTEDGTGIVHTAVMYGQDDFVLGTKVGLPKHHLVNLEGKFIKGTGFLEGRFVKEKDSNGKPTLDVDIIKYLTDKNLFFNKENYQHSYPHCWRCKTALIYYARDSWYIKMSDPEIKKELISQNKNINWEPSYIRDGRFGQWLEEIKDWAISRERYWGTPLPVWQCVECKKIEVIGSIEDLKNKTKKSGNKYFVMRHGGTEANVADIVSFDNQSNDHLTKKGEEQVVKTSLELKNKEIDMIIVSPFARTRETAKIIQEKLNLKDEQIIFDERLQEINPGDFDGKSWETYHDYVSGIESGWFDHQIPNGESLKEVLARVGAVLHELEEKYKNKNILIVTHGGPLWLLFVASGLYTPENKPYKIPKAEAFVHDFKRFANAEFRELPFVPVPHNDSYELDLHRPYIDEVNLLCECGGSLVRTREVMDVWFDSGAMPFAQDHYPFENKKIIEGKGYPADYICEAIDQTRGWFYTLHAVGVLMDRGLAYKNVICLGHLLDALGKKMSKSLGNVVDPWVVIEKYGVDTLRLWMYSVNQPGESKNFDEKTVLLLHSQVFGLLYNVLAFYELYRDKNLETNERPRSKNILDVWILARLDELVKLMTENLDDYKLLEPVRAIRDFIGDLSTWYLRRSRERIKNEDEDAKQTLYFVLKTLAKVLAPFAPFSAEDIWLKLRNEKDEESVHLTEWPAFAKASADAAKIIKEMQKVREIVSLGLEARQKAKVQVRQPLNELQIKNYELGVEYVDLVKEELNVKSVKRNKNIDDEVVLDTQITPELKQEGEYRELVRALQDMRKNLQLTPSDMVTFIFDTGDMFREVIEKFETEIKKTVLASKIEFKANDGIEIKIGKFSLKVKIDK